MTVANAWSEWQVYEAAHAAMKAAEKEWRRISDRDGLDEAKRRVGPLLDRTIAAWEAAHKAVMARMREDGGDPFSSDERMFEE
jgi:hypothetical protein